MKDTLVIMGSHPRTRSKFSFDRTDCDVWFFNEALSIKDDWYSINKNKNEEEKKASIEWAKRNGTAVFQMHVPAIWKNPKNRNDPNHHLWLSNKSGKCGVCEGSGKIKDKGEGVETMRDCYACDGTKIYTPSKTVKTIFMQDKYSDVPFSEKYPKDEILKMLGNDKNTFLSSSVSQAMALVAYQNIYKRIEIYGVAMETNTEYQWQREGVAYWYGYLKGKGMDVYFADETFKSLIYGYEGEVVLPYEVFEQRADEIRPLVEKHSGEYKASALNLQKIVDDFSNGDNSGEIAKAVQIQTGLSQVLGMLDGALQENLKYKQKADTMKEAAGEFIFSRQEFESAAKNLSDLANEWQTKVNILSGQGELVHQSIVNSAKGSPKRTKLLEGYKGLLQQYLQAHNQAMIYAGAARENFQYMSRLDKSIRAAGGEKSEQAIIEQMREVQNVTV